MQATTVDLTADTICPNCGAVFYENETVWEITVDEDGSVTVDEYFTCHGSKDSRGRGCGTVWQGTEYDAEGVQL